ncbi:MAG: AmmeMemoRadiSam system radical SAM enzyme [Caldisericota bacterium]|jgi:pyruvate formate lyase activating enzyme|nr:AmmeMemoRadiSam system radical SAM enzyme [Caldisericota bacterium]
MSTAMLAESLSEGRVRCLSCAHECIIGRGRRGVCRVRENVDGALVSLAYGRPVSVALDPVEKKPLFHFLPGSKALSVGTLGCNFTCTFCQNYEISQCGDVDAAISGQAHVNATDLVRTAREQGALSIAYTYNEPSVTSEYAVDIAREAVSAGLFNIFVSNGYYSTALLDAILPVMDAFNIDLKSMSDDFYRRVCGGRLQPVLHAIQAIHEANRWIEVTSLLIPSLNDGEEELHAMAHFIATVSRSIPWHVSRFFPTYRMMDRPTTPVETIARAVAIGREEGLEYVYVGNVSERELASDTCCPSCGSIVIKRRGYHIDAPTGLRCPACDRRIEGVER